MVQENKAGAGDEAAQPKKISVDEGLKLAIHWHQSGRFSQARAMYKSILELMPEHADALHFYGVLSHQYDTGEDALALIEKAVQVRPDYTDAYNNLGNVYKERGDLDQAVDAYRKAIALAPKHAAAYNNLAAVLRARGNLEEALRAYETAAELSAGDATIAYNMGNLYKECGDLQAAAGAYRKAIALDQEHAGAYFQLGHVLKAQGQKEQAIASYQRAVALKSDSAEHYYSLGIAFREKGLLEDAISAFRQALAQDSRYIDAYENAVSSLYLLGKVDESLELLRQWLRVDPGNPIAAHLLAATLEKDIPERASDAYIEQVFDNFAHSFDDTLKEIQYSAPEQSIAALARAGIEKKGRLDVLDAGCGTGLCGPLYRPYARRLVGVDLSAGMLAQARKKAVYDSLVQAELIAYLQQCEADFDLIVATDTLIYFGALNELMDGMAAVLRAGGIVAVSAEDAGDKAPACGYKLNLHGRYSHSPAYLHACLENAGLSILLTENVILRQESGRPVAGLVVVAKKSGASADIAAV